MSSKSEAYIKSLGSDPFYAHYDEIEWNSRKTEAQNIGKKSVSEVPSAKPCGDFVPYDSSDYFENN